MFDSARQKLSRAQHHIADLERQFKAFVARKPHRFSIKHDRETGKPAIQVRFVESIPEEFSVIIGDAIHNLRCALDHTMWRLVGWDNGTQDRHLQFPCRDDRTKYEAACKGIRTPSEWIKQTFVEIEAFPAGRGQDFYLINTLDITDKHRAISPVLRATTHPPFQIFHGNGTPYVRMEGNVYIGGIEDTITIAMVPDGGYVELDDNANCAPSIFLPEIEGADAFTVLSAFSASVDHLIKDIEACVAQHPKG